MFIFLTECQWVGSYLLASWMVIIMHPFTVTARVTFAQIRASWQIYRPSAVLRQILPFYDRGPLPMIWSLDAVLQWLAPI